MNESAEGMQGIYRRLTRVEIGMVVRLYRHGRELKRITLDHKRHSCGGQRIAGVAVRVKP